jgi:hypothetical protein
MFTEVLGCRRPQRHAPFLVLSHIILTPEVLSADAAREHCRESERAVLLT